jgi:hypothetical protein
MARIWAKVAGKICGELKGKSKVLVRSGGGLERV